MRLVCWWSAGVGSATATALALAESAATEKVVGYCASTESSEHPDNARFLSECQCWYQQPILRLYAERYRDTWDVWERTGWLVGVAGARCTTELKKKVRRAFQRDGDVQVFGFTATEEDRAERFAKNNPDVDCRFPLIEHGLGHDDCVALLTKHGIAVPVMYQMGYRNNNCIGCVKGGAGYWNKIRQDFPTVFHRMAKLERQMDVAILKRDVGGVRTRVFLDSLAPGTGRYEAEPAIECGVACEAARAVVADPPSPEGREKEEKG